MPKSGSIWGEYVRSIGFLWLLGLALAGCQADERLSITSLSGWTAAAPTLSRTPTLTAWTAALPVPSQTPTLPAWTTSSLPASSGTATPDDSHLHTPAPAFTKTPGQGPASRSPTPDIPERVLLDRPMAWSLSPGGKWLYEYSYNEGLRFFSQDDTLEWTVNLADKNARFSSAQYYFVRWSPDENFAYFHFTNVFDNDGFGPFYGDSGWLERINLLDGSVAKVADFGKPYQRTEPYWDYEFSPDMAWLAYVPPDQPLVVVLNMFSGQKLRFDLDPAVQAAGQIHWAQDSRTFLVFTTSFGEPGVSTAVYRMRQENGS